ncbi:MAG: hypothetical protein LW711_13910 [Saprospiraceae bacterium]|nr:hypothetical protein [Saprospiraceae bacterium]
MNENKTTKSYFGKYLFEFLILFLAVTLGFFAENYRESLVERKTERMYLESLLDDLGQDTLKIDFSIQSKETKERYFDTLYTILYRSPKSWPTRKLYFISRFLLIIGKVFQGKELAFLFDPIKYKGRPYSMGEPDWDPPLIGTEKELDEYFYWASNEIFIERNLKVLLKKLRISAKELIRDITIELEKE